MEQTFSPAIRLDDLLQLIRNAVAEVQKWDSDERLLSPAEACKLFQPKISKGTLLNWTREDIIKSYRIGGKVFYKKGDIMESLKATRRYQRVAC